MTGFQNVVKYLLSNKIMIKLSLSIKQLKNKYEVQLVFIGNHYLRIYKPLNMPPILVRFWPVLSIRIKKIL